MLTLVIQNQLAELSRMTVWLHESAAQLEIPQEILGELDLCLNEALTNTISYGYPEDASCQHDITVSLNRAPGERRVSVELVDDGVAFNPFDVKPYQAAKSLKEATLGGMGVHLIKSFSESQCYERRDGRNYLRFTSRTW